MRDKLNSKTMGDRIRHVRKEFALSQHRFANSIGISQGYLSEIESDKTTPAKPVFIAIECRYSVNMEWLFTGKEPKYLDEKKEVDLKQGKSVFGPYAKDTDLMEIMEILQKDPVVKKAVLKLLRAKKEIAEALSVLQDSPPEFI